MTGIRELFVTSRPRFWLYLAGPALVGVAYGAGAPGELVSVPVLVVLLYFLVPANVFLYGINDIYDQDVDAENPKKAGRERRYRGSPLVRWAVIGSVGLGAVLLAWLPLRTWPWFIGFLVLGAAYSTPPLRLKTRPPLDSISNGLYILPAGVTYTLVAAVPPPVLAIVGGWLWTMGMHTFSAIPDIEPDRRAGIETTATVLGQRSAFVYCGLVWTAGAASFAAIDWRLGVLLAVYPVLGIVVTVGDVAIDRAYWWFPIVNTGVGTVLTMAGVWRVVHA